MALPKTKMMSYAINVGKSVSYSAIDAIKESNPAITGFIETNKDPIKSAYNAIAHADKVYTSLTTQLMESKYGEFGRNALKNVKEDFKSGKWYNRERKKKNEDAMMEASGWGDSDEDFGFEAMANGDMDFFADDDEGLDSMMDKVGEKSSQAVSEAIIQTTEQSINAQASLAKATAEHDEAMYANIHSGMGTINENLGKLIEIANGPATTHMENSKTFFETETKLSEERNSILKEMLDIQKSIYRKEQKNTKSKITMYSILDENGMPDLELYFDRILKNINDNTGGMGDMMKDYLESGILDTLIESPLQAITDTVAKKLIPGVLKEGMGQLNKSIGGLFSSAMAKLMNSEESDNPILNFIKNTFGINDSVKRTIRTDSYEKGAVPFDGITRKSIVEVIPTYLARIESTLMSLSGISGKEIMKLERRFNFDSGKFVNTKDIKKNFRYITASEKERANKDINKHFEDFMGLIDFSGNDKRKKQLKKNFKRVMNQSFETGVLFNPNETDKFAMDYNLTEETADEDLALIRKIFESIPRDVMLNYANNVYSAKNSITNQMERLEASGHDISQALFNDSLAAGRPRNRKKKGSSGLNKQMRRIIKQMKKNRRGGNKGSSSDDSDDGDPEPPSGYNINENGIILPIETGTNRPNRSGNTSSNKKNKNKKDKNEITRKDAEKLIIKGVYTVKVGNITVDLETFLNETKNKSGKYTIGEYLKDKENKDKNKPTTISDSIRRLTGTEDSDTDEEEIEKIAFDNDDVEATAMGVMDALEKMREKEKNKNKKKKSKLREKLDDAAKSSSGIAKLVTNVEKLIKKPTDFLAGIIKKADEGIYELIFGVEFDESGERKSVAKAIFDGLRDSFDDFREWMKKTLKPIRDWFNKEGTLGNKAKKFAKEQLSNLRESEFGQTFKKFFKFGKDTVTDAAGTISNTVKEDLAENKEKLDRVDKLKNALKSDKKVEGQGETKPIPNAAAGMRRVKKTGVIAVSEGEMVVPPDMNPANIRKREANENREKKKFAKSISDRIYGYDSGGIVGPNGIPIAGPNATISGFTDSGIALTGRPISGPADAASTPIQEESMGDGQNAKAAKKQKKKNKEAKKESRDRLADLYISAFNRDFDGTFERSMGYEEKYRNKVIKALRKSSKAKDIIAILDAEQRRNLFSKHIENAKGAVSDALNRGKDIANGEKAEGETTGDYISGIIKRALNTDGEMTDEQKRMVDQGMGDIKNHLPEAAAGGVIGAGISFLTGAVGGPLVGAAVGSGVSLILNSESLSKMLFGDKLTDEKGNVIGRKGNGILSEELTKGIHKYAPNMAKGSILGAVTSLLPIVPFGPVTGAFLGTAIGFATKNEEIHEALFGEEGFFGKDGDKKIKKALPALGIGAAAGLVMGPFGAIPNIMLGSAAGFATTTDKFKDILFGEEGDDGKRHGGVIETAVHGLFKPIGDFTKSTINNLVDWANENIKQPLKDAIAPLKKQFGLMVKSIHNGINSLFKEHLGATLDDMIKDYVFKPVTGFIKKATGWALKPLKMMIAAPFRAIGWVGNKLRDKQVRKGNADYMTADERIAWREKRGARKSFGINPLLPFSRKYQDGQRWLENDKTMSDMSGDQAASISDAISQYLGDKDLLEKSTKEAHKKFTKTVRKNKNLSAKQVNEIADKIKGYVNKEKGDPERAAGLAHKYVNNLRGLSDADKKEINDGIDQYLGSIKDYYRRKDEFGNNADKIQQLLGEAGLNASEKEFGRLRDMLDTEAKAKTLGAGEDETDKAPSEENEEERHRDIMGDEGFGGILKKLDELVKPDEERSKYYANMLGNMSPEEVWDHLTLGDKAKDKLSTAVFKAKMGAMWGKDKVGAFLDTINDNANVQLTKKKFKNAYHAFFGDPSIEWKGATAEKNKERKDKNSTEPEVETFNATADDIVDTVSSEVANVAKGGFFNKPALAAVSEGEYLVSPETDKELEESVMESISNFAAGGKLPGEGVVDENDNETKKNPSIFDKIKEKAANVKDKVKYEFSNGRLFKFIKDNEGEYVLDKSDSETMNSMNEMEEERKEQKSLFKNITDLPKNMIGNMKKLFLGEEDAEDKKNKKGLLGKIFNVFGGGTKGFAKGLLGNSIAAVIGIPILTDLFRKFLGETGVGQAITDGLDSLVNKLGLADNLGDLGDKVLDGIIGWLSGDEGSIGGGLPNLLANLASHWGSGVEFILTEILPGLTKGIVKAVPGIVGGVVSGVGELFSESFNAIWNKNEDYKPKGYGDNAKIDLSGLDGIETANSEHKLLFNGKKFGDETFTTIIKNRNKGPGDDASYNIKESLGMDTSSGGSSSSSSSGTSSTSPSSNVTGSSSKVSLVQSDKNKALVDKINQDYLAEANGGKSKSYKDTESYNNLGSYVKSKLDDQIYQMTQDGSNVIQVNTGTEESPNYEYMTIQELLASDIPLGTVIDESGNAITITGSDILNDADMAAAYGLDIGVSAEEGNENAKRDHQTDTIKNKFIRRSARNFIGGKHKGIGVLRVIGNRLDKGRVIGAMGPKPLRIAKRALGKGFKALDKTASLSGDLGAAILPESIVGSRNKTHLNTTKWSEKRAAKKVAKEGTEKVAKEATETVVDKAAKETVDKVAKEGTEKAAKEATEKVAKEATETVTTKAAKKATESVVESAAKESTESATGIAFDKINKELLEEINKKYGAKSGMEGIKKFITETIEKFGGDGFFLDKVKEMLKKGNKEASESAVKKAAKAFIKGMKDKLLNNAFSRFTTKHLAKIAGAIAKATGWATATFGIANIAFFVIAFKSGWDNTEGNLGIVKDDSIAYKPGLLLRFISAIITAIDDVFCFSILIPIETIMDILINLCMNIFGLDKQQYEEILEAREQSDKIRAEYLSETGYSVSAKEYNNRNGITARVSRALTGNRENIIEQHSKATEAETDAVKYLKENDLKAYNKLYKEFIDKTSASGGNFDKALAEAFARKPDGDVTVEDLVNAYNEFANAVNSDKRLNTGAVTGKLQTTKIDGKTQLERLMDEGYTEEEAKEKISFIDEELKAQEEADAYRKLEQGLITPEEYQDIVSGTSSNTGKDDSKSGKSMLSGEAFKNLASTAINAVETIGPNAQGAIDKRDEELAENVEGITDEETNVFNALGEMVSTTMGVINNDASDTFTLLEKNSSGAMTEYDKNLGAMFYFFDEKGNVIPMTEATKKGQFTDFRNKYYKQFQAMQAATNSMMVATGVAKTTTSTNNIFKKMSTLINTAFSARGSGIDDKAISDPKYKDDPSFVSQVDSKYANKSFNVSGDSQKQTIADTGCGPASAAMVVNNAMNSNELDMRTAAKDALKYKVKDGGVNAAYFEDEFSKHGLSTRYIMDNNQAQRNQDILSNLYSGNRTVLMGSDAMNKSKAMSPYGSNDHYIVATRASKDGRFIWVNDPESKTPEVRYPASVILNNTKMGIAGVAANGSKLGHKLHTRGSAIDSILRKVHARGKYGPDTVEYKVWNALRAAGLDEIHVAAIMGNIYQESKFDPSAIEKGSGRGFGLIQWTDPKAGSGRRTQIESYAASIGKNPGDLVGVQIPFLVAEMTPGGGCNGYATYQFMKQTKEGKVWESDSFTKAIDLDTATRAFCWTFERPRESDAMMDVRLKAAKDYYESFTGQQIDVSIASGMVSGDNGIVSGDNGTSANNEGTLLDKIFSVFTNLGKAYGLISGDSGTSSSTGGISSTGSMAGIVSEKQQQLVEKMKSVEGQLDYSQSGPRNPDQGSADCSSTVQWAYKSVLGQEGDPGDWSGAYATSPNTYTVTEQLDPSVMQPGDAIVYNGHIEMYAGDGQMIGHGGPGKGPTTKQLSDKKGRFKMVRRWNGFKDLPLLTQSATHDDRGFALNQPTVATGYDDKGFALNDTDSITSETHDNKGFSKNIAASGSGLNPDKEVSISDTNRVPYGESSHGDKRGYLKKSRYSRDLKKDVKIPASTFAAGSETDDVLRLINKAPSSSYIRRLDTKDNSNNKLNMYLKSILKLLAKEVENTSMLTTIITILKELIKTYEEERKLTGSDKELQQQRNALESKRTSMLNILNATGVNTSGANNDLVKLIKDAEKLASI